MIDMNPEDLLEDLVLVDDEKTKTFFHKTDANPNAIKYLDNEKFGLRVAEYVESCRIAEEEGKALPIIPDDIATSLTKIIDNLARSRNFSRYTWIDEMKSDAIENCIRYIRKFNINAPTRTGKPEAFSYFTRIVYFAFLRRIKLENAQIEIKESIIRKYNVFDSFYSVQNNEEDSSKEADSYTDKIRHWRDS
jgi:hypothetical protein